MCCVGFSSSDSKWIACFSLPFLQRDWIEWFLLVVEMGTVSAEEEEEAEMRRWRNGRREVSSQESWIGTWNIRIFSFLFSFTRLESRV